MDFVFSCNFYYAFQFAKKLKHYFSIYINLLFSEVLLYDVGVELVVNINCLRELQENLKTMGRLSLECSLVDIR